MLGLSGKTTSGPSKTAIDSYDEWRDDFAIARLRILYYLGLVANPVFLVSDALFYREHFSTLLMIRTILQSGLLLAFFGLVRSRFRVPPQVPLISWVLIANLCVAHMTVTLGGFPSSYYNGLNLVLLAAAVIVPVSWLSHLSAQAGSLLYYYGVNFLQSLAPGAEAAALQNSFFLVWTCIACLFSVYLYEMLQRAEFAARAAERRAREELEVSHHKLLESASQLERVNSDLRELSHRKSEFVAIVSHDLRTPLTAMIGFLDNLLGGVAGTLNEKQAQYVDRIKSNSWRLVRMVNDLLDIAKIESGAIDYAPKALDLTAFVESVVEGLQSITREKGIRLHAVLNEVVWSKVDPDKLNQVLTNLIDNACKFTKAGGEVRVEVTSQEDGFVQICVADTGTGISPDDLPHVFEKFYRGQAGSQRGAGLGLAIVKHYVELHGGRIWVESTPLKGSRFYVAIPCIEPERAK